MTMAMDAAMIRSVILSIQWNHNLNTAVTAGGYIFDTVIETAVQKKILERKPQANALTELQIAVCEVVWELLLEGVLAPGSGNSSYSTRDLPQVHFTEHGKRCLAAGELTPHDPQRYLERIKNESPAIDPITILYLGEALRTFKYGSHLSTAVMVGVAAENILLGLVGAVRGALDTPARQAKFEQETTGKKAKVLHDKVLDRLTNSHTPLPATLGGIVKRHIDGIFDLIRESRNDAGHPTGRLMERSETHALLLLFPVYCKTAHELITWLAANKI